MEKKEARVKAKEVITNIHEREKKEKLILERLYFLIQEATKIITYSSDRYEINTDPLGKLLQSEIYYPKIESIQEKKLSFILPETFVKGHYSIPEPIGSKKILPREADFILVPALAFSKMGYRLGRGGGYYDRNLEGIKSKKLIGLSFEDLFWIDFTPSVHDIRVGTLITEASVYKFED